MINDLDKYMIGIERLQALLVLTTSVSVSEPFVNKIEREYKIEKAMWDSDACPTLSDFLNFISRANNIPVGARTAVRMDVEYGTMIVKYTWWEIEAMVISTETKPLVVEPTRVKNEPYSENHFLS